MRIWANAAGKKLAAVYACLAGAMLMFVQLPVAIAGSGLNETRADIQCLIVGARLSESPSPSVKLSGGMLMTYFLGRVDGRTPDANIESLIVEELRAMSSDEVAEASRRCTAEFSRRGVEFTKIGNALARKGR
jgi:hypothetical protein